MRSASASCGGRADDQATAAATAALAAGLPEAEETRADIGGDQDLPQRTTGEPLRARLRRWTSRGKDSW